MSTQTAEPKTAKDILTHMGVRWCGNPFCKEPNMSLDEAIKAINALRRADAEAIIGENVPEFHDASCRFYDGTCHCPAKNEFNSNRLAMTNVNDQRSV